jgi:hypothetical protein
MLGLFLQRGILTLIYWLAAFRAHPFLSRESNWGKKMNAICFLMRYAL